MRHLRSILYALVLAPAIWILAGVGFTHDLTSRGREFFAAESISGLLLLIFAGILYTILAFAPVSPAGPVLTGVAYLGVTVWAWNSPADYAGLWPAEVAKDSFDLSRPGYGLAALLAIPLLGTALSARRWSRYEPPVLPIIGEIGRFRGAATAPGIPISIAETTVLRAGDVAVPVTPSPAPVADRTAAMPAPSPDRTSPMPAAPMPAAPNRTSATPAASDDQTVTMSATPDDRTAAMPATHPAPDDRTATVPDASAAPDDQTVAMAAVSDDRTAAMPAPGSAASSRAASTPNSEAEAAAQDGSTPQVADPAVDSSAAWDPTIAVRTPEAEPTTVFVVSSDETTVVAARPAPPAGAGSVIKKLPITANPDIAGKGPSGEQTGGTSATPAVQPHSADDEETHRLPEPAEIEAAKKAAADDEPTLALKADEEPSSKPAPAPQADDEPTGKPAPASQAEDEPTGKPAPAPQAVEVADDRTMLLPAADKEQKPQPPAPAQPEPARTGGQPAMIPDVAETPADDLTEPFGLPLPATANGDEPTTYIPAQRHPSRIEA